MSNEIYRFGAGSIECITVSDGTFTYAPPQFPPPAALLFMNAPKERLDQALLEHQILAEKWEEWTSPYICLVVKTSDHLVLVDTGAGGLAPTTGRLIQNLKTVGITPADFDTVILTHAHPDHISGNTDARGDPAFPNARYVIWKDEWDFWTSDLPERVLDEHVRDTLIRYARQNLPPIEGKVYLMADEEEIVPGIRAVRAPGHTPGHMALEISSNGDRLLCISDVALHPLHLEHPEWYAAVDIAPDQAVATRRKLFNRATNRKALVLAFHFPFPGLGRLAQAREGWQWQPIG